MADSPFWPSRQRGRAAMGLPNDNMQQMAQLLQRRNEMGQPPPTPPSTVMNPLGPVASPAIAPPNPPSPTVQTAPAPPPVTGPGDQLPSVMTQSATAADANNPMSMGPDTPGFWQRFNKAIASGQVPEGYRGVMGELIKNG